MTIATKKEVLDYWFSTETEPKWFIKNEAFDNEIRELFIDTYNEAKHTEYIFDDTAEGVLAQIIVLDQFPRNMFRNDKQSFATDELALKLAHHAIEHQYDTQLNLNYRRFLYMPLMHSENITDQQICTDLFANTIDTDSTKFAIAHKEIILRFGRFPHRNIILGRQSTNEEIEFLKENPGF